VFDIYFVSGADDRWNYPKIVTTAGLAHQFGVIQHGDNDLNQQTTADPAMVRAIAAFLIAYDADAEVMAGNEWEDLGKGERPLSDYMAEWEVKAEADRDPPMGVAVRKAGKALAYMLVEPWYGVGGPWPFADSCTYTFFTDRDIGPEIEAYLRGHPDAARWNIGPVTIPAKAADHYPIPIRREDAVVPRRRLHAAWYAVAGLIFALVGFVVIDLPHWRKHDPAGFWEFVLAICGIFVFALASELRGLDVTLSWEGIRRGSGPRSTFIAWKDARLDWRRSKIVVRSGKTTIAVYDSLYRAGEFYRFFDVIAHDIVDGGLRRAAQAVNLATPAYTLSAEDMKALLKYRGEGRGPLLPPIGSYTILALVMPTVVAFVIRFSARWHNVPQALHPAPAYLAATLACTVAIAAPCFLVEEILRRRARWKALTSSWHYLQDFSLSISEAGVTKRTIGFEHFRYWDELQYVVQSPRLILFLTRKGVIHIVPKRIFASPDDAEVFFNTALTLKRAFVA
jgi:hypothetical protein